MKMRNGVPKNAGATSGMIVFVASRPFHIRNSGIMVTCGGSIIVAITITRSGRCPRQPIFDSE